MGLAASARWWARLRVFAGSRAAPQRLAGRGAGRLATGRALCVLAALGAASPSRATMAEPRGGALALHVTVSGGAVAGGAVLGSAFSVGDGVVVTNAHVVSGLAPGAVVTLTAGAAPRRTARARLLAVSARMDLAVLRAPAGFLPTAPRRLSSAAIATPVSAAGVRVTADTPHGRVVRAHGHIAVAPVASARFGEGLIATMAGVGPGFSGGPVVDDAGRLVGMVTAVRRGGREAPVGSAFAPIAASARSGPAEAFVIGADALRAEARRLIAALAP